MSVTDAAAPETMRKGVGALRGALAPVAAVLDAERERWFLWVPVLVGLGIAAYFALPAEPPASVAVALFGAAAALPWVRPARGTGSTVLYGVLIASALGFALAKLRAETVAAPCSSAASARSRCAAMSNSSSRGRRAASASRSASRRSTACRRRSSPIACACARCRSCRD